MLRDDKRQSDDKKMKTALYVVVFGIGLIILGLGLSSEAYGAHPSPLINHTAILEDLDHYDSEFPKITGAYHVIWVVLLLIMLAFFMAVMLKMREDKEASFFSIGALIFAIVLSLLFSSPLDFDYQQTVTSYEATADNIAMISSTFKTETTQIILIPSDMDFRNVLVLLFTGIGMFNGLYTILIMTNFKYTRQNRR